MLFNPPQYFWPSGWFSLKANSGEDPPGYDSLAAMIEVEQPRSLRQCDGCFAYEGLFKFRACGKCKEVEKDCKGYGIRFTKRFSVSFCSGGGCLCVTWKSSHPKCNNTLLSQLLLHRVLPKKGLGAPAPRMASPTGLETSTLFPRCVSKAGTSLRFL